MEKYIAGWAMDFLQGVGRMMPNVWGFRSVATRILRPLGLAVHGDRPVLSHWNRVAVIGKLTECVDHMLVLSPQLYDREEFDFIFGELRQDVRTFVDVGANIGWWSLRMHAEGIKVVASIEANPDTYSILVQNFALNGIAVEAAHNVAVGDKLGVASLYLNEGGNRGGDSLNAVNGRRAISVRMLPLRDILHIANAESVDLLKADIEGYESVVFKEFFSTTDKALWPKYVVAESLHDRSIEAVLESFRYKKLKQFRENAIYCRG